MIEILKKTKQTAQLMRSQSLKPNSRYKWSYFVYPYNENGKSYLHHNLTKQLYALEENDITYDKSRVYTTEEIQADKTLQQLQRDYYLVEEATDEGAFYEELIDILVSMDKAKQKKGYSRYTILPTTACNARCVYCFEEGMKTVTMTPQMVQATIDFIMDTKADGPIVLGWFGGEPLLRPDIIDTICTALKDNNVEYVSTIITNGSLITEELAHKMKTLWNLDNAQVSLDGSEEEYIKRKRYINPTENPYQLVMRNVGYLLNEDIKVTLRCNFDEDNLYSMNEYIDDISASFLNKTNLTVYFSPLYGNLGTDKELYLLNKSQELLLQAKQKGFNSFENIHQGKLRLYFCGANNPKKSVCIAPDGRLYACEHCDEGTSFGNIFEGITDKALFDEYDSHSKISEKCSGCKFVPNCTTFKYCYTFNQSQECKKKREIALDNYIHKVIHNS